MAGSSRLPALLGLLALLAATVFSAGVRIGETLGDPNFDAQSPRGLLRTDPAFLLYITERIVDAGGLPPEDFRADPRVEWPETSDLAGMFTVGQEFAVAWAQLLLGDGVPIHVRAVWLMSIIAALAGVGAYGLTWELTRKHGWAAFAVWLWAVLPANYRTVGFVLIREDFSFPFFALHLWLFARALRVQTAASVALAAAALLAASATWHALGFMALMEGACVALWFLRTGENPLAGSRAWVGVLVLLLGALLVPVLWTKQFAFSMPMQVLVALFAAGVWAQRKGPSQARFVFFGGALAWAGLSVGLALASGSGLADYGHVTDLIAAKLRTWGELPADPDELSFGARLLWQGPFATAPVELFTSGLAAGSLALVVAALVAAPQWIRGQGDGRFAVLVLWTGMAFAAAFLIVRVQILPGLLSPVLAAVLLSRLATRVGGAGKRLAPILAIVVVAGQGVLLKTLVIDQDIGWYSWPGPQRIAEREHLFAWIEDNVPADQPIVSDFLNSAAILAFTGHPIVQQPKYETGRSRDRIEQYFQAFFQGTPRDLYAFVWSLESRWLVVDRPWMANNCYIGGIAMQDFFQRGPRPGTAAAQFIHNDPNVFGKIPGFRLRYTSPPELGFRSYAVYQLMERRAQR